MFNELYEFLIIQNIKDIKSFNTLIQCLASDLGVVRVVYDYVAKCFSTPVLQ